MDDIERRALLGVAGVGALAALSSVTRAGPLTPPAGAVAPTGRTLDEVYNRIPATGASDGRTPIPGGSTVFNITQPGSYVLTGNLTVAGTGITVSSPGVTLDLNGFRVTCTNTGSAAINVGNGSNQLVIRNGSVAGGQFCINVSGNCLGVLIEDVVVSGARLVGINLSGSTNPGAVIRKCAAYDIGATTVSADSGLAVQGIATSGSIGCRVESCTVAQLTHNGTPTVVVRGIQVAGVGGSVDGCVVSNNTSIAGSTGVTMLAGVVYRNNKVVNFATAYSPAGTDGGGNF